MEESHFALSLPNRPVISSNFKAQKISLISNHYSLISKKSQIYMYSFQIEPEVDKGNRRLVSSLIRNIKIDVEKMIGEGFVHSGWILIGKKQNLERKSFKATIDKKDFTIDVKFDTCIDLSNLDKYSLNKQSCLQFFNIVLKNIIKNKLKFSEVGINKKFYDLTKSFDISEHSLTIFKGFLTSALSLQSGTKLKIDFSSRIFNYYTCYDQITYFKKENYTNADIENEIVDTSVVAYYGQYRIYKVHQICWKMSPKDTFYRGSEKISYADYFKQAYKFDNIDMNQPLLFHEKRRTKDKIYLLPQFCYTTGITDAQRNDFHCMTAIAEHTRLHPCKRMEEIGSFAKKIQKELDQSGWDIYLDSNNKVQGFLLEQPKIQLKNSNVSPQNGSFQREIRVPIYDPMNLKNWILVCADGKFAKKNADQLIQTLQKCSSAYSIKVNDPLNVIFVKDPNNQNFKSQLQSAITKYKPEFVITLIEKFQKTKLYRGIKEVCYLNNGVYSQNVVSDSLYKNSMSVCSNILLQMNIKATKPLWRVFKSKGLPEHTMIIGADVHHNLITREKSVIGFCATADPYFTQFFSKISHQKTGTEVIEKGIVKLVQDALINYFQINKKLPELILFYRDGVGEGQLQIILDIEVKQIIESFEALSKNYNLPKYKPQFAEIIVNKQISDRFFIDNYNNKSAKSPIENPQSGTIIESVVVSKNFDFFLIAQKVTQGTCTPSHYFVLHNDTTLTSDTFFEITFSQCFNYYNWQGAIKIPAVVKYADRLAMFVGQNLKQEPNVTLINSLFYL